MQRSGVRSSSAPRENQSRRRRNSRRRSGSNSAAAKAAAKGAGDRSGELIAQLEESAATFAAGARHTERRSSQLSPVAHTAVAVQRAAQYAPATEPPGA